MLKATKVLDPNNWPDEEHSLADFGVGDIQILVEHYSNLLIRKGFDVSVVEVEWIQLLLSCQNIKSTFSHSEESEVSSRDPRLVEVSLKYLSFWQKFCRLMVINFPMYLHWSKSC